MEKPINHRSWYALPLQFIPERLHKYLSNLSWLLFEKMFTLLVGMVVGIYVARYLQPEKFGLLNYAISFVGIFSVFSTLGLDQIVVRELAKDMARKNELLGTSFVLKLCGSLFLMILISLVLIFMKNDPFTNLLIIIIAAAETFRVFEIINYFYQAKVLSKHVVRVQVMVNLAASLIKIFMVYEHAALIWFAWIILFTYLLNALGFIYTYRRHEGRLREWRFSKPLALNLVRESWPLTLYGVALYTQARIDQVMLGKLLNNYEVGQYSVALKIIEIFGFIPMVVMSTFSPAITKAKSVGQALYDDRLTNFYRAMFILFLAAAIPLFLFGENIIVLLYGKEYQPAGVLLSLFALRLFFTNMGVGKSVFIVNESLFRYSLVATLIGATVNIAINYILIPAYASIGAIIASFASFTVSIFLLDLCFSVTRRNQKLMFKGIFSFWKLNRIN
ncbi:MAG TPA: flippase [Chryseosolibacter sp.]